MKVNAAGCAVPAHFDKNAFIFKFTTFSNRHLYFTSLHLETFPNNQRILFEEALPSGKDDKKYDYMLEHSQIPCQNNCAHFWSEVFYYRKITFSIRLTSCLHYVSLHG